MSIAGKDQMNIAVLIDKNMQDAKPREKTFDLWRWYDLMMKLMKLYKKYKCLLQPYVSSNLTAFNLFYRNWNVIEHILSFHKIML